MAVICEENRSCRWHTADGIEQRYRAAVCNDGSAERRRRRHFGALPRDNQCNVPGEGWCVCLGGKH